MAVSGFPTIFQEVHPVRRFPVTRRDRDFVIGDIHGAYSLIRQAPELLTRLETAGAMTP